MKLLHSSDYFQLLEFVFEIILKWDHYECGTWITVDPPQGRTVDQAFFLTLPSVLNPFHFLCVFSLLLYLARCLLAFITIRKLYRIIFMNSRSKFQDLLASVIFSTYILGHNFIVFCGRYFKII